MALRPIPSEDSWTDEIVEAALSEATAVIDIVIPGKRGTYDAVNDTRTGGTPDVPVITGRAARVQQLGQPSETTGAGAWGSKLRYIVQFEIEASDPLIRQGMVVKVSDGGGDATLVTHSLQVQSASGSNRIGLRTLRAVTEGATDG